MISLFNRLKKKKGFTIVELIVVMAIMAVIVSMILPNIFTSDKPAKGAALSKEFFYKAQDTMVISKVAYPEAFGTHTEYILYVELDNLGNVSETGQFNKGGKTFIAHDSTLETDMGKMMSKFDECAKLYFTGADGMGGTVFVQVNNDFMVETCYWIGATPSEFTALADLEFDDEDRMDSYYAGSFPGLLTEKGMTMFSDASEESPA